MRGNNFKEKKVIPLIFTQFWIRSHLNKLDRLTPQDVYSVPCCDRTASAKDTFWPPTKGRILWAMVSLSSLLSFFNWGTPEFKTVRWWSWWQNTLVLQAFFVRFNIVIKFMVKWSGQLSCSPYNFTKTKVEFWILVLVFPLKKQKQIFDIQNVTYPNWWATEDINSKLLWNSWEFVIRFSLFVKIYGEQLKPHN